jgi:Outer membrane protein beta-barrel domain
MSIATCDHAFSAHFALPHVDDKNDHMKRPLLVIVIWFLTSAFGFAQDEKAEVAVFAGGYFNSGFQSFKILNPTTGAQMGTFKPTSEANSGIFGVRSSYNFRPQLAAEATFGFSPAGRSQNSFPFGMAVPVFVVGQQETPIAVRSPVLRDGNVYLYSGTLLTYFNQRGTWRPFFTVGAGAITRTSKIAFVQNPLPVLVRVTTLPIISPTLIPSTTRTDMALVLGVGFKKYLPHGLGARMDFRDHINKFDQSTVNNMELSFGLFTRF